MEYKEVEKYYKEADAMNCAKAMSSLGCLYLDENDTDRAMDLFKRACDRGDGMGCNMIGEDLRNRHEYKSAFKMFLNAKKQNCLRGIDNLGLCYVTGQGVAKNKGKAKEYFIEAIDKGYDLSILHLANLLESEDKYAESAMMYRQFLVDNKTNPEPYIKLAEFYEFGKGVEKNYDIAFKYYEIAGNLNDPRGLKKCGDFMYTKSRISNPMIDKAINYYNKAANLNKKESAEALIVLAEIYMVGCKEISKDTDEARRLYRKAYELDGQHSPYAGIKECCLLDMLAKEESAGQKEYIEQRNKLLEDIVSKYSDDSDVRRYIKEAGLDIVIDSD